MFDILNDEDNLFEVYYSGSFVDSFLTRREAEACVSSLRMELEEFTG